MFVIIGAVIVIVSVVIGFTMVGGKLLALWHPNEIIIICGGAFGAFLIANPVKVVKATVREILALLKPPAFGAADYLDLFRLLNEILIKIRREGMMAIEDHVENPENSTIFLKYPKILGDHHLLHFITDCLRLMVGGSADPNELETLLEQELETHHHEALEAAHALNKVADALPGFGIVAAVLGIINTMSVVGSAPPEEIGMKVASALVGCFLGIFVGYGFAGPIAAAMEGRAHANSKPYEIVKMALVSTSRGYAPPVAIEFARKLLNADLRPGFLELEADLKANKA